MLKEFLVAYVNADGWMVKEHVLAADASQAVRAYVYAHPDVDESSVTCIEE